MQLIDRRQVGHAQPVGVHSGVGQCLQDGALQVVPAVVVPYEICDIHTDAADVTPIEPTPGLLRVRS